MVLGVVGAWRTPSPRLSRGVNRATGRSARRARSRGSALWFSGEPCLMSRRAGAGHVDTGTEPPRPTDAARLGVAASRARSAGGVRREVGQYAQRIGIPTVAVGLDLDLDQPFGDRDLTPPPDITPEELDRLARRTFVETYASALVGTFVVSREEWRPDVMMRDRSEYAAWVVGDAVGAPVVTLTFGRLPQPAFEIDAAGDASRNCVEARASDQNFPRSTADRYLYRHHAPTSTPPSRCCRQCRSYSRCRMTQRAALTFLHGSRISVRAQSST